jgi:hypothetical protein
MLMLTFEGRGKKKKRGGRGILAKLNYVGVPHIGFKNARSSRNT